MPSTREKKPKKLSVKSKPSETKFKNTKQLKEPLNFRNKKRKQSLTKMILVLKKLLQLLVLPARYLVGLMKTWNTTMKKLKG
jgi:hypothetical protein